MEEGLTPAERVAALPREQFIQGLLDDPDALEVPSLSSMTFLMHIYICICLSFRRCSKSLRRRMDPGQLMICVPWLNRSPSSSRPCGANTARICTNAPRINSDCIFPALLFMVSIMLM